MCREFKGLFKRIKKILLICLLICFSKVSAENINALVLHMVSGKQVAYMFDELPIVSFKGEELVVTTSKNVVSYQVDDVVKFTYSDINSSIVDETKKANIIFKFEGDILRVYNLEPLSTVSIYSLDGSLVVSADVGITGEIILSYPQSVGNVFIVKTSVANFKLIRP